MKSQLKSKTLYILNSGKLYFSSRKKEEIIGSLILQSEINDYHTFVINKPEDANLANIIYSCISNDIEDSVFIKEICEWVCKWWISRCEDYFVGFHSYDIDKQITNYIFKHISIHYQEFIPLIKLVESLPMIQSLEMSKLLEIIDEKIFRRMVDDKIINSKHIEPIYLVCNKWLSDFLKNKGNELRTRSTL